MYLGRLEKALEIVQIQGFPTVHWKTSTVCFKRNNIRFTSPPFSVLDVTWQISVRPSSEFLQMQVFADIKKLDFCASFTLGIMRPDGTVYKSTNPIKVEKRNGVLYYKAEEAFFYRSDILRDEMEIAPHGMVTIFVSFSYNENFDVATQTGTNECTEKLAQDLKSLLLQQKDCDTTIKIRDKEFRAHRLILGARSTVFASMYSHDTSESNTGIVEIEDCDPEVFQSFLLFLYSGKLENVSSENLPGLYVVADKYDIQDLKTECLKLMANNLSVDSVCEVVALAVKYNEPELLKSATDFFAKNITRIIVTTKWICFVKEYPMESNELCIKALEFQNRD